MQVSSDNEIEIDPYWVKIIIINELQGLGNPVKVHESDTDSMPHLESMSASTTLDGSL